MGLCTILPYLFKHIHVLLVLNAGENWQIGFWWGTKVFNQTVHFTLKLFWFVQKSSFLKAHWNSNEAWYFTKAHAGCAILICFHKSGATVQFASSTSASELINRCIWECSAIPKNGQIMSSLRQLSFIIYWLQQEFTRGRKYFQCCLLNSDLEWKTCVVFDIPPSVRISRLYQVNLFGEGS